MVARPFVTGGGGSIGSELVRQMAKDASTTVFELSEYNLYTVEQLLKEHKAKARLLLGDVRHGTVLSTALDAAKADVIFHAAALKHVPILEHAHNLIEAVRTNVLGTVEVLEAAAKRGCDVVIVSTDKAVQPLSVMGWTKSLAEQAGRAYASLHPNMKVSIVRFGNVIGSSGSVVPLFERQIAAGGPITITHPDMVRYFMTIGEAVELIRKAHTLTDRGACTYVFDMGAPVRIVEVAQQMVRFSGKRAGREIEIKYIGLRPGEKLHEELTWPDEALVDTTVDKVRRVDGSADVDAQLFLNCIEELRFACEHRDAKAVTSVMRRTGWSK